MTFEARWLVALTKASSLLLGHLLPKLDERRHGCAPPIELIDGEKLLDMLEKLELGLKPVTTFEVEHAFFKEFEA